MRGKGMLDGLNQGHWQPQEDLLLKKFIEANGVERWSTLPAKAGLNRCGKSCRLRWMNYLRPNVKRGDISEDEKDLITKLHKLLGNRWSLIAARVPGRTDNDVKNFWNSQCRNKCFKKAKSISETNDLLHITPSPSKTLGQEESHGTLSDIKESCNGIIGDIEKGSNEILSDLQETPSQYLFDVLLDSEFLRFGCVPWLDSNNREIFECNYVFDSNPISQIDLMDIMC